MPTYVAVDLGASGGRVVAGHLEDGRLRLDELGRFPNGAERLDGHLRWDVLGLFAKISNALKKAKAPAGIGVDSWGVDFGLLGQDGSLLGMPVAYRDPRTEGAMEEFFKLVSPEKIYRRTGIQFMSFNTLYQLFAMRTAQDPHLEAAADLLFIPDLMHYFLSGRKASEHTDASTSQMLNVETGEWDQELLEPLGLKPSLLQEIVPPGTVLGPLTPEMQKKTGLGPVPVVAPATHDTASAVAAVPAEGENWAFLSSGTWSLMGVERRRPVVSEEARRANFTNEGGVEGTFRLLKNITGLWLAQSCRAEFEREYDFAELARLAEDAPAFASLIDVDDPRFLNPASMTGEISKFCRESGQPIPEAPGEFIRCALESLALRCRGVLDSLEELHGAPLDRIHVVGGGVQNELLCQMTADATGRPVLAGPVEATVTGNLIVQARALGHLSSVEEGRRLLRDSFTIKEYEPKDSSAWDRARERYREIEVRK